MKQILNLFLMMFTLLIILLSVPFAVSEFTNRPIYIDPEFRESFEDFKSDAEKYEVELNVSKLVTVFSYNVNDTTAAFCIPATKTIIVSLRVWQTLNKDAKKALLYHEWGHCILRREHVEQNYPIFKCPLSIMYPYIDPMQTCYNKENQESYNRELFTNPHGFETFSRRKK